MPDASREDMEQYFADAGWTYHRLEGDDWETRYSGTYTNQVITVRMTQYWVYFYATLINRVDETCRPKMFEHLAMLNYKVSFGKFSIDKSNRICLGVEVPRENLQSSVFKDALNALSYLIDEHFRELLNIATDPEYISKLKQEQESGSVTPPPTIPTALSDTADDEDVDWGDDDDAETTAASTDASDATASEIARDPANDTAATETTDPTTTTAPDSPSSDDSPAPIEAAASDDAAAAQ